MGGISTKKVQRYVATAGSFCVCVCVCFLLGQATIILLLHLGRIRGHGRIFNASSDCLPGCDVLLRWMHAARQVAECWCLKRVHPVLWQSEHSVFLWLNMKCLHAPALLNSTLHYVLKATPANTAADSTRKTFSMRPLTQLCCMIFTFTHDAILQLQRRISALGCGDLFSFFYFRLWRLSLNVSTHWHQTAWCPVV